MVRPLLALLLCTLPLEAGAGDIYIGTDANGVVTFTDTPPGGDDGFAVYWKDLEDRPDSWAAVDKRLLKKNLDRWDDIILEASSRYEVAPELLKAMMLIESGMNPKARSRAGAQGLMQLMPGTARGLGVDDPWDPRQNVFGGARYIRRMLDRYTDRRHAIAAYNAGPGNVDKHGGIPPFRETRMYVQKVEKYYAHFLAERPVSGRR